MLDVIVRLFFKGVQVNGKRSNSGGDDSTAVLGKAVLGKMKLGKT